MYTPERGVDLTKLRDDVKFLKRRYALDIKGRAEGRLVLRCVFLISLWAPFARDTYHPFIWYLIL